MVTDANCKGSRNAGPLSGSRSTLRAAVAAILLSLAAAPPAGHAASTTNFSDQWWIKNESGWGMSVLQQANVLFIDLFVYGVDGKPTWFVAPVTLQEPTPAGHVLFKGNLVATTGPWFGGAFDPATVTRQVVGTLTFEADSATTATVTYTVGATKVTKLVERQTWTSEDFTGGYLGGIVADVSGCASPAGNGHVESQGAFEIVHAGNAVTISDTQGCTYVGTYTQSGHMGRVDGAYTCPNAAPGNFILFEMERTFAGMTARMLGVDGEACQLSGRMGGVRR